MLPLGFSTAVAVDDIDILAAGVALGHAGEWEALRGYLKSSYKASQLGQVRRDTHA
jgi:hypothetical protein